MTLTMTDLFAGAGGSSTGAIQSGRVEVRMAANHWDRAVEVHNANHHEVAAGMAFPRDYLWSGTRRERVRMAGNAVTQPAARDILDAVADSLVGAA